jgi:hypothetical protein
MALGTFGKERQSLNVGKPGAQSPITPITAYVHERYSEELLASLFVGNEVASIMSDLQDQAHDWLNAWKGGLLEEPAEFAENVFTPDEEIPF